jgi:hypothetical protein
VDIWLIWVGGEAEFFASRRWTEGQISALELLVKGNLIHVTTSGFAPPTEHLLAGKAFTIVRLILS